ncbi:cysteine-rich receptor-like protein kinase 8 [Tanacetum coccineum]|uniref:Cysteine-rich receptor-like protein kinase 8 n=1 Tax=Tanacetum coccineum TaxID=301880 RepID=A0ABQ4WN96_9ASTR
MNDINSPHHPLYFHPNDHPGLLLISKRLFGSENYSTWKRSMLIVLSAKNKLKLVNRKYEEPDSSSELRAYWERANDMLISWILNTVSEQIGNNLTFVNSASTLWNELSEHYSQLDGHRIYQLANEICVCVNGKENSEREHRKRLIQFLMGLDECYTNIRGQILLMQPLPTAAKAYTMLRQKEKQRDTQKQHLNTPIALNTYKHPNSSSTNTSQTNNNPIHSNNHPNTQSERRGTFRKGVFCGYCKKEGHHKEECYKLLGYPIGSEEPSSSQSSPLDPTSSSTPTESLVYAKMDQLQNQLNQDHDGKTTHGTLHGGLYLLPIASSTTTPPTRTVNSHTNNLHLWHARLGHTSFPII